MRLDAYQFTPPRPRFRFHHSLHTNKTDTSARLSLHPRASRVSSPTLGAWVAGT